MISLFVENITSIDFSWLSKTRGLVGETWIIDVTLTGKLNNEGMVFDFGKVKKTVKNHIDNFADHKLLVPANCNQCNISENLANIDILYHSDIGDIFYKAPKEALCILNIDEITPEAVSNYLTAVLQAVVADNIANIELKIYQETASGNYFHYSHGLKHHQGDCQRLAHGHRSRMHISINDEPNLQQEQLWCKKWSDIYLLFSEYIINSTNKDGVKYITAAYTSKQGYFEISLPAYKCYIINSDTTIELICKHLCKLIYLEYKQKYNVAVKLFEGYQKGAICRLHSLTSSPT